MSDTPQTFIRNTRQRFLKMLEQDIEFSSPENFRWMLSIALYSVGLSPVHLMQGNPSVSKQDIYNWIEGNRTAPKKVRSSLIKTMRERTEYLLTEEGARTALSGEIHDESENPAFKAPRKES